MFGPKRAKKETPQRADASTTDADPGRVGRVEQGKARPRNSASRVGPQLELFRRRLKTRSKSEPSAALVQAPTCLYMYLLHSPFDSVQRECQSRKNEGLDDVDKTQWSDNKKVHAPNSKPSETNLNFSTASVVVSAVDRRLLPPLLLLPPLPLLLFPRRWEARWPPPEPLGQGVLWEMVAVVVLLAGRGIPSQLRACGKLFSIIIISIVLIFIIISCSCSSRSSSSSSSSSSSGSSIVTTIITATVVVVVVVVLSSSSSWLLLLFTITITGTITNTITHSITITITVTFTITITITITIVVLLLCCRYYFGRKNILNRRRHK